ncbi:MAG: metal ABC transporter substrate-binding protein [Actinomycetes bacterium]
MRKATAVAVILAALLAACGGGEGGQPRIVVTTNILGDVVSAVAGDEATVEVLIPAGADPHEFQASSEQAARMARADLVVANGLGLEEGLLRVLSGLVSDGVSVLEVAPALDPIPVEHDHEDDGHDPGDLDPHFWMDPLRVADAARLVAAALEEVDPGKGWMERAEAYGALMESVHAEIEGLVGGVPEGSRLLVTNHATLGYFADRYGWEVAGTVIPGGSSTGAPSSGDMAALVRMIRERGIPAIFADATRNADVARAVAEEAGGVEVVELHTESLTGPDGPAPTLADMLAHDARAIAGAMGG